MATIASYRGDGSEEEGVDVGEVEVEGRDRTSRSSPDPVQDLRDETKRVAVLRIVVIFVSAVFLISTLEKSCDSNLKMWIGVQMGDHLVSIVLAHFRVKYVAEGDIDRARLFKLFMGLVSCFAFSWLIFGHMLLGEARDVCGEDLLYILIVALLAIRWYLLLPFVAFLLVLILALLCLPCILRSRPKSWKAATQKEINKLRVLRFNAEDFEENGFQKECAICIEDFEDDAEVRQLKCDHIFHKECVDSWLLMNGTCPTCRERVNRRGPPPT